MLIPRIFHQIWFEDEAFPEEYTRHRETWLHHHPDWELRFWTEKNLPEPKELRRPEASERLRSPRERSDVFRLEVLWRFGGVYVDPDLVCLRSIEPLIGETHFFIGLTKSRRVNDALFGAVAGHAALDHALEDLRPLEFHGDANAATGAMFLDRLLANQSDVTFFDREVFDPQKPDEIEKAYAVHGLRAWDTLDGLWQSLLKAERRWKVAQKEARKWRAKYEEAEAKLPAREDLQPVPDNVHPATTSVTSVRIPPIFHQIWLGPDPFPEEYANYQKTWLRHHPGWELRLWSEENLPEKLRRPEAAERLRVPAERADILRLELIWRFGGVYIDTDVTCLRSIEPLIEDTDFFIMLRRTGAAANFFFGAVAGHPILDRGLDEIRPSQKFGFSKTRTGPRLLDRLIAGHRNQILLLEPAKHKGYVVHHRHRTYLGSEALRADILRAKREMQAAQDEITKWRARSEETDAGLWKQG